MRLEGILEQIKDIAQANGISTPFICGGTPRDKFMNRLDMIDDLDLTTGDESIHLLAQLCSKKLSNIEMFKVMNDGHAKLKLDGLNIDFSSNFIFPNVKYMLQKAGMKNPTMMQQELYSRDFTCNALLMDLNLKTISDPTGLAIPDIKKQVLKTCLPVNLTLGIDIKRIPRIIYLASKLNFAVDPEIITWVRLNKKRLNEIDQKYISKKIKSAMKYNKDIAVSLIHQMDLINYIPVSSYEE